MDSINLRLIYDGAGPVHWSRQPGAFGLQDKDGFLQVGVPGPDGTVSFDITLQAKAGKTDAPVLLGSFAHGPPGGRFLYLAWREPSGAFAQRLKLPLGGITWADVHHALARQLPLVGVLVDHQPRATSTGANIGGHRPISWRLP